ncbi:MarR family transcriptional regulator [Rhodomicrobium udaipurense JA643]|uniref:MarR family transcriptional regulator n=1 Tax=Rhodomicrobium udaipurense TaxID=1202716 RepID=A0A8I1KH04_9HYPH|nr:helix-turn-helix domain-containing protein [Rhodomicrobium udaipurense]KAI93928.1 MarR family transcriptional regulator [Rhodomicrobium udaipurense JA643]MBJ7543250.1 MarR family transcriptional regulator [Rhodomicrobium udaipurense]
MTLTADTQEPVGAGLWVSVSDLAARKGVTKQTISERVAKLVRDGLIETRPGPGRAKLVNLAAYDQAVGETGDAAKALGAVTKATIRAQEQGETAPSSGGDHVLAREQARRAAYEADLAKLRLDEKLGRLLPIEDVEASMVRCAEALTRAFDQLPARADDLAAAVAKDGVNGARAFLKVVARDTRAVLAKEMRLLDKDEPDEPQEATEAEQDGE